MVRREAAREGGRRQRGTIAEGGEERGGACMGRYMTGGGEREKQEMWE